MRKFRPAKWHKPGFAKNRPIIRHCPCGGIAVTNTAADGPACAKCLAIEHSFAEGEIRRASKIKNGLGKYMDWALNWAVPMSKGRHCV